MDRNMTLELGPKRLLARTANWLTDRRGFLVRAGRYGSLMLASCAPAAMTAAHASAWRRGQPDGQQPAGPAAILSGDEVDVLEQDIVRVLGVAQRRPGLTRRETKFRSPGFDFSEADRALINGIDPSPAADRRRPTALAPYYTRIYAQLTGTQPGRGLGHFHNVVVDGAFGVDQEQCTSLANRDLVTELPFRRDGGKPAAAGGPDLPPPDSVEGASSLNLVVQQVVGQGTRPGDPSEAPKAMYFLKLSPGAGADSVKRWQAIHAKAIETTPALAAAMQGHELLQRLGGTPDTQVMKCVGTVTVPDLVANFWAKTTTAEVAFQTAFENYVRAFRLADQAHAIDHTSSFFLLVQEFHYTS